MGGRKKHPKKEVEDAIQRAEETGWIYRDASAHAWGRLKCSDPRCQTKCQISVNGTPKNPGNHANQIDRAVRRCRRAIEKTEAEQEG